MHLKQNYKYIPMVIIPIIVAIFNLIMIMFPKEIIISAKYGLLLWYNSVLPSLLPFMICTNILTLLGFPNFIGTLLEPLVNRVFKIKGCGIFPILMGIVSGYPMGAKLTVDLYTNGDLSKNEAQRLILFTNNSGPLFILGAVSVGMFSNSQMGYFLMLIHYISSLTIGIVLARFAPKTNLHSTGFKNAVRSIKIHRLKHNKTFGEILGESTYSAIQAILQIGGYIILFSVLVEILNQTAILQELTNSICKFGVEEHTAKALCVGTMEITNSCSILSQNINMHTILLAGAVISWGGFSIHAQTISFISKTDLKVLPYIISKFIHGILTYIYGFLLYPVFKINQSITASLSTTTNINITEILPLNMYNVLIISVLSILAVYTLTLKT